MNKARCVPRLTLDLIEGKVTNFFADREVEVILLDHGLTAKGDAVIEFDGDQLAATAPTVQVDAGYIQDIYQQYASQCRSPGTPADEWLVVWEIDAFDAEDALTAAKQARACQIRPGTTATVFKVRNKRTGEIVEVDLIDESIRPVS